MNEIAKVSLDNEMDLIIAHKRSMKLAELSGLSLSAQTSFATAVSEVARTTIENGKSGSLTLSVDEGQFQKFIVACIRDQKENNRNFEGLEYAKRLVNKYSVSTNDSETLIELFYVIPNYNRIDIQKLDEWRTIFRNEPAVSPYEEIKKQNQQLQELSDKIQKSEARYKTLTESLPLIIFSLSTGGELLYANEWLLRYTGETMAGLNESNWKSVVHEDDYDAFRLLFNANISQGATTIKTHARLKQRSTDYYLWHQISVSPFVNEKAELQYWIGYIVDIHAQKVYEEAVKDNIELKQMRDELKDNQQKLENYISELNRSNLELQQFAFVASHDLQEPVRKLLYYSDFMLNRYASSLDEKAIESLKIMHGSSYRMRSLIQDLLLYSQINRQSIKFEKVDLNDVGKQAVQDLEIAIIEKKATIAIDPMPVVHGDEGMLRQLFENILSNSLKYSKPEQTPVIRVSYKADGDFHVITFNDNGIGFDEKYLPQIFTLFQRLHSREKYEGTGLGLAICLKIAEIHKGKIEAHSAEGKGASFSVYLPVSK